MEVAERFNRVSLALATYRGAIGGKVNNKKTLKRYGKDLGEPLSHEQAKDLATEVVEDAHFIYGKSNRPEALRGGTANKLMLAAYTFRSFTHHLINLWTWMFQQGGRGKRAAFKSLLASIAIGGMTSITIYKTVLNLWRQLTGDDPEEWVVEKILPEDADMLRDMLLYGLPAISGFTMGGSIGMELPVFERLSLKGNLSTQLLMGGGEILGVPWATLEDSLRAVRTYRAGQGSRALESLAPVGIANIMKGVRMGSKGTYTVTGRPINYPWKEGPRKLSRKESIGKMIGFQPVESTKSWNISQRLEDFETYKTNKRADFANKLVNAARIKNTKDREESLGKVIASLERWNDAKQKDNPEYMISDDEIIQSINARTKTRKPPKYLWGKLKELKDRNFKETP